MVRLRTASGKADFEYFGDSRDGIDLLYGGGQHNVRVGADVIAALLLEFSDRPNAVVVGTSFSDPPLGSIGDWLQDHFGQNVACYLVPSFEDLGMGEYDTARRRFRFTPKSGVYSGPVFPNIETQSLSVESFDSNSLAKEAARMMARISDAVSKLALSPVKRIECKLSEFKSAEEAGCRFGQWSLPPKGEFVVYRFQTANIEDFYAAFPEGAACSYKLSRKNTLTEDGVTLYVGSSRDFSNRLKQHFGFGLEGTYALHLMRWAGKTLWDAPLAIEYWTVQDSQQVRPIVLQTVEDYLWDHSRPIFGRRGSK